MIEKFREAPAVTLVGARAGSGTTQLLLKSLRNKDVGFSGPINAVSRSGLDVPGVASFADLSDVPGELGVGWLMTGAKSTLEILRTHGSRFTAIVAFGGGYREAGDNSAQAALARWSEETKIPVLGPQSIGYAFLHRGVNLLDVMWNAPIVPGPIGIVAQSGGVLTALLGAALRNSTGISAAFSVGNEAVVDSLDVIDGLIHDEHTEVVVAYVEQIRSPSKFARVAARAAQAGKPLVLILGGTSDTGYALAESHTGALATPLQLVRGIAAQYGVMITGTVDESISAADVLLAHGGQRLRGGRIGVFTNTQGLNVLIADRLDEQGVRLPQLTEQTARTLLAGRRGLSNPYDAGGGVLGNREAFASQALAFAADESVDIVCHVVHQPPSQEHPDHLTRIKDFASAVRSTGKPLITAFASAGAPRDVEREVPSLFAWGISDAVIKLRALARWSASRTTSVPMTLPTTSRPSRVESDDEARVRLASVDIDWPNEQRVLTASDVTAASRSLQFPVVAKAMTGDAHRARVGAVIMNIDDEQSARAAVEYLTTRFDKPVMLCEYVEHVEEFFIGLSCTDDGLGVVIAGSGGESLGDHIALRVLPLTEDGSRRVVRQVFGGQLDDGYAMKVLEQLGEVLLESDAQAIDLNPLVVHDGRLVALDAKLHLAG